MFTGITTNITLTRYNGMQLCMNYRSFISRHVQQGIL